MNRLSLTLSFSFIFIFRCFSDDVLKRQEKTEGNLLNNCQKKQVWEEKDI